MCSYTHTRTDLQQGRFDFVLQESFDFSAVRAHTSYWDDHDTALFILHAMRYRSQPAAAAPAPPTTSTAATASKGKKLS